MGLNIFYIPPEKFLHPPHATPPMPSHTSLHISLNVCHVTSHHPPPHITHPSPTPPHPHIPMHPYTYPPMFVMLLHTTHPPMPFHASLHISPNVCHVTSHHLPTPPRPTHPTPAKGIGGGGLKIFYIPPEKFLLCGGDLKMPVHLGGLKTETGKFFLHFQLVCVLGNFLYLLPNC